MTCCPERIRADHLGVFDTAPVWPLCGRIAEAPPPGWNPGQGCPPSRWGNPAFTDAPLSSSFGPRQLVSEGYRYDFHRGIDIPTSIGTPVFALVDGVVRKAGLDPGYSDPLVQLRHYRPGHSSCSSGGGCYTTNYLHMSGWVVEIGDPVSRGDLIGYSGASASGFAHVHFEIRDAPSQDPFSNWSRNAIHPLELLPYPDSAAANLGVSLDSVDASDPLSPRVRLTVTIPMGVELDLDGVEAEVYERMGDGTLRYVAQPGDIPTGNTIEGAGYLVASSWYSMAVWNRQYSYKNSSSIPWNVFLPGGAYESPYGPELPGSYDPNVHLDAQDPANSQVGLFNGMSFAPSHSNASSSEYAVAFEFLALEGVPQAEDLCIQVRAVDVHGSATDWVRHNCTPKRKARRCGLGFECALVLPLLLLMRRRRGRA